MAAGAEVVTPQNCANCRHALPVTRTHPGFTPEDYRHCATPHPELRVAVAAWLIAAQAGCAHTPSRWEPAP